MSRIAASGEDLLFTPRFLVMCGFSVIVFFSVFELIPTTPFQIRETPRHEDMPIDRR